MNVNPLCFYDFETGSKNKKRTQPLELGMVVVDARKLTVKEGGIFHSLIRPIEDLDECTKLGIDPVEQEALDVNKLKMEDLRKAPLLEHVWKNVEEFITKFNPAKKAWNAPIRAGFNICNFDNYILDRLCEKFGNWDKKWETQNLFHPVHSVDVMHDIWRWTESIKINPSNSISMDSVRTWLGISTEKSHNAIKDTLDTCFLGIKFLKLHRNLAKDIPFENSFDKENKAIAEIMKDY